ncbi:Calcium-transporting ATPase 12, plasma membrane-type [Dichanthelium oligosanthes]|uniref:Calcium-transporting ATPase n=1 Tax=Dichanthelium oligosanthes TaxID=888268 RepID=A0A1E5UK63_9POAL|nr:Calcium-transporting ATPase 12, plasma membrane-type [Dichanthelium oligosanthes]
MECADYLIAVGGSTVDPMRWLNKWRKAMNVVWTCHMLARLTVPSGDILRSTGSYGTIKIHEDEANADAAGTSKNDDAAAVEFSVAADDEDFKGLVKEKRVECFRRLGNAARIAAALASGAETGIHGDEGDVRRRREAFGANTYPGREPNGFLRHVWNSLSDVFLVVLFGLKDGWYDGVSTFLVVFLGAVVSTVSKHGQAKLFARLANEPDDIAVTVVRAGRRQEVSIFDVVVGDVVVLKIGDVVPADGVFLEGHALQVDESRMNGKPHPVHVDAEKSPFLASGVKVIDGYGRMLVTAVGTDTACGEMMSSITREKTKPTPLPERLEGLASSIGKVGIAVAMLVFAVLTARHFTGSAQGKPLFDKQHVTFNTVFSACNRIYQQVVTIIMVVIAIPEGLPLAVRLTLAFSMKRMVKEHALVRALSACETMGSVTTICTDKTGTLTLNQMKVTEFWVGTDRPEARAAVNGAVVSLLCQGAGLNTTGSVYKPDNVSPPEISGSPTEKALLSWAVAEMGMDADALKRSWKVLHVEAFNSDKMRSGVLIRAANATGAVIAHWQGAAEIVLVNCSAYVGTDGAAHELGVDQRRNLEKVISDMAAASLRCIAFAYKQVNGEHSKIDDEGLTLLAFISLKDPCRPEVRTAIEACMKAGVAVKMVTGDNVITARAIAKQCGIISDNDRNGIVIEGRKFRAMSPEHQLEIVDRIRVMARSLPRDKLVLVQRLKQKGHVVAVTGDGSNDAPALKEADVGLSMGIQGTEVAKESSDIVIMNNFDTVVTATLWGRCVFNNIQKFIQFQLTGNVAALIINFVSALTSGNMPLTTVQLLWMNLIMDTMGALALATDRPTKALMRRPPIGGTAPLISNAMWRNLAAQAALQVAGMLALQYRGRDILGVRDEKANGTMIFNAFVLCQVFNEFNAREIERKNVSPECSATKCPWASSP